MTAWLHNYQKAQLNSICDFTEKCGPVPVKFSWHLDAAESTPVLYSHLFLSLDPELKDPDIYLTAGTETAVEDLYMGTKYYWQAAVTTAEGTFRSEICSFTTGYGPRTVYIDGMSNTRDIGGWNGLGGRRVRQGIIYRGADLAHLTGAGADKAANVLKIRTELDLRLNASDGTSPFGPTVKYCGFSAPWYGWAFHEEYREALCGEIRFFTDPANFPVYYHCSLGRDRTGTLTFMLLSLCGVSETDFHKDYETSFFSSLGGYGDRTVPSDMVNIHLHAMIEEIKNIKVPEGEYDPPEAPLYARTRTFLKGIGLTDAELDAVRDNLLE